MRSPWKSFITDPRYLRNSFFTPNPIFNLPRFKKKAIADAHTYIRSGRLDTSVLNKRLAVYTGYRFSSFIVKPFMLNRRASKFFTKKQFGRSIHFKKKKKKGKKKSK